MMTLGVQLYHSIAELAKGPLPCSAAFHRIFRVEEFAAACNLPSPQLATKYGFPSQSNVQHPIAVRNTVTADLVWFNPIRSSKPQNFKSAAADVLVDPTSGLCDFCQPLELTAEDSFGRIENEHAVSCSNLFKYTAPFQGVVLFKHHHPLDFTLPQLQGLLDVAAGWFGAAAGAARQDGWEVTGLHPLLVWNCGPRAGASFYHGHVQTMLSAQPFPALHREAAARAQYEAAGGDQPRGYYADLVAAHEAVGLVRRYTSAAGATAAAYAALCPVKDAEITVMGSSLTCPAFQTLLHAALRTFIDELGVKTFNACVQNIPLQPSADASSADGSDRHGGEVGALPVVARIVSRGKLSAPASDYGGLEVFGGATIGHTDPWQVAVALDIALSKVAAAGA